MDLTRGALALLLLAGCPPTSTRVNCVSDSECLQGEACVDSICQEPRRDPRPDAGPAPADAGIAPTGSCSDGIENGDESDVDCGGSCPDACAEGAACASDSDCATALCGAGICRKPASCKEILAHDPTAKDGEYLIDPDGPGGAPAMPAYCRMAVDGGGWTLLMRTVWDWESSKALLTGFADFYGASATASPIGQAAPSQAYRLPGRHWAPLTTTGEHLVLVTLRGVSGIDCAPLAFKATTTGDWAMDPTAKKATLTGTLGQPNLAIFISNELSTLDSGPASDSCVKPFSAVPWPFDYCCNVCPTFDGFDKLAPASPSPAPRPTLNETISAAKDLGGSDAAAACAQAGGPDRKVALAPSFHYYAANRIEYLVR